MKTSGMIEMLTKSIGWPKAARILMTAGLAATLTAGLTGCSSTEGEEGEGEGEEVVEGGNEEAATAEGAEESVPENEAAIAEGGDNVPPNNTSGINNVSGDPAALAGENPAEAATDPAATTAATDPSAVPADPAAIAAPAVDPATPASVPAAAAGPGLALPAGASAVVYVSGALTAIYDAPNGREIGRMAKGDFVLASAEGEWAKTHDGKYVRASDLSTKPVGRKRTQSRWRSPGQK
ncbi:MAG: hypothetical protein RIQ81_201 [Pseudomonadota bacterium]|jgi:hypothetical protein